MLGCDGCRVGSEQCQTDGEGKVVTWIWKWFLSLDAWNFMSLVISQGILKRFCWRPEPWVGFLALVNFQAPHWKCLATRQMAFLGQAHQSAIPVTNRILLAITGTIGAVWIVSRCFNMLVPLCLLNIKSWLSVSKGLSARMTCIVPSYVRLQMFIQGWGWTNKKTHFNN